MAYDFGGAQSWAVSRISGYQKTAANDYEVARLLAYDQLGNEGKKTRSISTITASEIAAWVPMVGAYNEWKKGNGQTTGVLPPSTLPVVSPSPTGDKEATIRVSVGPMYDQIAAFIRTRQASGLASSSIAGQVATAFGFADVRQAQTVVDAILGSQPSTAKPAAENSVTGGFVAPVPTSATSKITADAFGFGLNNGGTGFTVNRDVLSTSAPVLVAVAPPVAAPAQTAFTAPSGTGINKDALMASSASPGVAIAFQQTQSPEPGTEAYNLAFPSAPPTASQLAATQAYADFTKGVQSGASAEVVAGLRADASAANAAATGSTGKASAFGGLLIPIALGAVAWFVLGKKG